MSGRQWNHPTSPGQYLIQICGSSISWMGFLLLTWSISTPIQQCHLAAVFGQKVGAKTRCFKMFQVIQKIVDKEVIFPKRTITLKLKLDDIWEFQRFKLLDSLWHLSSLHCLISNKKIYLKTKKTHQTGKVQKSNTSPSNNPRFEYRLNHFRQYTWWVSRCLAGKIHMLNSRIEHFESQGHWGLLAAVQVIPSLANTHMDHTHGIWVHSIA